MSRPTASLAAGLFGLALACQGTGVPTPEIPPDPIAIQYRNPEQARRRAESLLERGEEEAVRDGPPALEDITGYLGRLLGAREGEDPDWAARLALLDPRSGTVELVDAAVRGAIPLDWSADHQRLLFSQAGSERFQLMELDLTSRSVRPITHGPDAHPRGCYGPDGRIVYLAVDPQRTAIRILLTAPAGGDPVQLSRTQVAHSPACAPDGSAVAYVTALPGGAERIVTHVPVLDGAPRAIAPGRSPTFTPDGEWIVYSAPVRGEWKLWRIRPDGTGRAPIGRGAFNELRPAISPDGELVAYVIEAGVRPWLYLRRFDGSGDRILFSDGDADNPVW